MDLFSWNAFIGMKQAIWQYVWQTILYFYEKEYLYELMLLSYKIITKIPLIL